MARIKGNVITHGMRGKFQNTVIKNRNKTQYTSKLPDTSGVIATDLQTALRGTFADAVSYAQQLIQNPGTELHFTIKEDQTLFNAAISYYCTTNKITVTAGDLKQRYSRQLLKELELSQRQIECIMYVQRKRKITNAIYQKINKVSKATATRDLQHLVSRMILIPSGSKGIGASYTLGD